MFVQRLKELRMDANISQKKLSENLCLSQQAVAKWETGKSTPDPETLLKIAEYFDVSVDYLLGKTDIKKAPSNNEDVTFDDFTFALHGNVKDLSDEGKQQILDFVRYIRAKEKKENKNDDGQNQ